MVKEVLIMIPAFNEEDCIVHVIEQLYQYRAEQLGDILVINDGSTDNTAKRAKTDGVYVIDQIYNLGYGAALQLGYKYAVEKGYKYVIQMDADGQHDACNIERIYQRLKDKEEPADIVIGSRFLPESQSFSVSGPRRIVMHFFQKTIKAVTKQDITDPTSGLQGLNARAFTYYAGYNRFDYLYPDINMIIQMLLLGFHVKEIPAVMHQRETGMAMHSGLTKQIKYMALMSLSTLAAILRNRKK